MVFFMPEKNYKKWQKTNVLDIKLSSFRIHTVCPGSSDPFYIVTYNVNWVTTSWTYSNSISYVYNVNSSPKYEIVRGQTL